jgi:dTDP-4-amino-4,6-dideoxygalactose transaminase
MLKQIEARGVYSNFGPVNTMFEDELVTTLFNGEGFCTTVCNATLGLMITIRALIQGQPPGKRKYALMPSFTFAAAAQAAVWCGLQPLFCDIDPDVWAADPAAEEALLREYGDEIAVIMPYATFGYDIDLARYEGLSARYGIPVVVDAAASLGTVSRNGKGFGAGSKIPVIFSMHATKSFATGEGGLIYSADKALIDTLKQMSNFGFGKPRTATMPGLNAKLSEVSALQGRLRLHGFSAIVQRRMNMVQLYRRLLPELTFQPAAAAAQSHQFTAALLPASLAGERDQIAAHLAQDGIGMAAYFSPHLAEQDYFRDSCISGPLPVTNDIASRIISLPLYDAMTRAEVAHVVESLRRYIWPALAMPVFEIPAGVSQQQMAAQ